MSKTKVKPSVDEYELNGVADDDTPPDEATSAKEGQEFDTLAQVKDALSGCGLHVTWMGYQRSVDDAENAEAANAIGANEAEFSGKLRIMPVKMEEWKDLARMKNAAKDAVEGMTFPYVVKGQRLFRKDHRKELWGMVKDYNDRMQEAAKRLQAKREEVLQWGRDNLGKSFRESLYPEDFSTKFSISIREYNIEPPSYLRATNAEEYQQELKRKLTDIQWSMQQFERQCMEQVGRSMATLTSALGGDGSVKTATVENMQRVFSRMQQMSFEGTAIFKAAMSEAQDVINGVSLFDLRSSAGCRKDVKEKLEGLLNRYKGLKEASLKKNSVE